MTKHGLHTDSVSNHGWAIRTVRGPIMGDAETEQYRALLPGMMVLPEMVYSQNVVELVHQASGTKIVFTALDALKGWCMEKLPPLQVKVAAEWRKAREVEIQQQQAVQLTYDWTFTTPYNCTVVDAHGTQAHYTQLDKAMHSVPAASHEHQHQQNHRHHHAHGHNQHDHQRHGAAAAAPSTSAAADGAAASATGAPPGAAPPAAAAAGAAPAADGAAAPSCSWVETSDQIDRALLMERDPILLYDEVVLYESDLDDNGVNQVSVKLRVMPKCWLVLLRVWMRVDGSTVRLRESRLFCRHDKADKARDVLMEVKHTEGAFAELRKLGAPDEGSAYADADAASQTFAAVAPIGLKLLKTFKLVVPAS